MKTRTPKKKGQSSIEFLMTYGWAIVIIGVAMVLLWQWGFFNPTGNIKFTTLGFWGVVPADAKLLSNGDLLLSIRNDIVDGDVDITDIRVTYGGADYNKRTTYSDFNQTLVSGNLTTIDFPAGETNIQAGGEGSSYDLLVQITYVDHRLNSSLYQFTSSGTIAGSIEKA